MAGRRKKPRKSNSRRGKRYYVVWVGMETGVYSSWGQVKRLVNEYPGAKFKAFNGRPRAEQAFEDGWEKHWGIGKRSSQPKSKTPSKEKPLPAPVGKKVECPYCGNLAEFVSGKVIYPKRSDLWDKRYYHCSPCRAYVGSHGDGSPFGTLATSELRQARMRAHEAFDTLWKESAMNRSAAYAWLSEQMELAPKDTHIGMFDVGQCEFVVEVVKSRSAKIEFDLQSANADSLAPY